MEKIPRELLLQDSVKNYTKSCASIAYYGLCNFILMLCLHKICKLVMSLGLKCFLFIFSLFIMKINVTLNLLRRDATLSLALLTSTANLQIQVVKQADQLRRAPSCHECFAKGQAILDRALYLHRRN